MKEIDGQSMENGQKIDRDELQACEVDWVGSLFRLSSNERLNAEGGRRLRAGVRLQTPVPLVSVVTVCFNSFLTIEQTILSVLGQSYSHVEYIIVDGGSTDGTLDILNRYQEQIEYYVSVADKGLYDAMNKGISLASGDYIIILNSDDWYSLDCITRLVDALEYSNADFVSALAQYVDKDGNNVERVEAMPFDDSVRLRMSLRHETMLLSAAIYNAVGRYSLDYSIISDLDYAIRLYFRNTGLSHNRRDILLQERNIILARQFPYLDDDDLKILAVPGQITSEGVLAMVGKYPTCQPFIQMLRAFYDHQRTNHRAKGWSRYLEPFPIEALEGPAISVILPVYNASKTLHKCIDSILCQSLKDIEIICIDDCSVDQSPEILHAYAQADSRIRVIENETNYGLGSNRNKGVAHACGKYIFHVDPDDTIPTGALETLYWYAQTHGSDMIKGGYLFSQTIHGKSAPAQDLRYCLPQHRLPIYGTDLRENEELLTSTEGHWSYLYKSTFARRVRYPRNLKMGQDSIFLVRALVEARSISIVKDIVYHYMSNSVSSMNSFNYEKYCDAIEWRRRAFYILNDAGFSRLAKHMVYVYWSIHFFEHMTSRLTKTESLDILKKIDLLFRETGHCGFNQIKNPFLKKFLLLVSNSAYGTAYASLDQERVEDFYDMSLWYGRKADGVMHDKTVRVATISTFDHIGAGVGTARRVDALRSIGIDAHIYTLVSHTGKDHVFSFNDVADHPMGRGDAWKGAVRNRSNSRGFRAHELFTSTYSAVSFEKNTHIFDDYDIIHLHWAIGILDYEYLAANAVNKPIIWTLADMNAITGGCHYSEGCEQYKQECSNCPLIVGEQEAIHETWKYKKEIYAQLKNLTIVCPSKWLARKVRESTLLGGRDVYYIPNAFPIDKLCAIDQVKARKKFGLPMDKKLFLFGAQALNSHRKGGEILKHALHYLQQNHHADDIEIVLYGKNKLELSFPTHDLGFISDLETMALAYSAVDAFLFPSREDNAPLTVVESLLCGTPVIAFPVGHVPDIVTDGETGYIANYCDARSFAAGMDWIASQDAVTLKSMSEKCQDFAQQYFDPEMSAKRHCFVYNQAMKKMVRLQNPEST